MTIQQASGVIEFYEPEHTSKMGMDDASIREHEEVTKVKNIQSIQIGCFIVDTWYFSPFPKEFYPTGHTDRVGVESFGDVAVHLRVLPELLLNVLGASPTHAEMHVLRSDGGGLARRALQATRSTGRTI